MRYLGIDYGKKRLGLAISDATGRIAQFYKTIYIKNNKTKFNNILKNIIKLNEIEAIVIGLPYHLNKDCGKEANEVKLFGENLIKIFLLPVFYEDERLSTVEANKILIKSNMKRNKRKEKIDSVSAAIILQKFIDKNKLKILGAYKNEK